MARRPSPKPPSGSPPDNVVALSRWRAQLGRGRRNRRIEELFAQPEPDRAIRALPPDEFFYVVAEAGFPDALEVVEHATPEQIQVALDFAVWDRDQLSLERADEWLGALVEAPYERVGRWFKGLDVELVALLLRKRARIHDLTETEAPDDVQGQPYRTPDGFFLLDLLGEDDQPRVTARLLDALYRSDRDFARRVLVGTRAELDSELEEAAYRWRSGRMADLGFVDFYEALEVYREIDPSSVEVRQAPPARVRPLTERPDDGSLRVPAPLAERLASGGPFARAISTVSDPDELSELHFALVSLSNRVLSADRVTPGDMDAVSAVLARLAATLDLAVEFLGCGSDERAGAAVRSVPMVRLFQVGVSLIGKVRRLGLALQRESPFAALAPRVSLFEQQDADVLAAVTRLRPVFPRLLETPPAPGERPFASLADLGAASAALERAGAAIALVHGLGVRPDHLGAEGLARLYVPDPSVLDTALLARSVLVPRLLGAGPAPLRPLPAALAEEFARRFKDVPQSTERTLDFVRAVETILAGAVPGGALGPAGRAVAARWAASLLPLEPVLTEAGPRAPGLPGD